MTECVLQSLIERPVSESSRTDCIGTRFDLEKHKSGGVSVPESHTIESCLGVSG